MHSSMQGFRISPQQERLWRLQQAQDVYRAQCLITLEGAVDHATCTAALQRVVARHEMLRTTFLRPAEMQLPWQCVAASSLPAWQEIDLRAWTPAQQAAYVETLFQQERRRPFDLENGPLLRVLRLTLAADRQALLVSLPALCADAWTLQNIRHELSQAYAVCRGEQAFVAEPVQYVQVAAWQHTLLEDEDAETGKAHWRQHDLRLPAAMSLPFARSAGQQTDFAPEVFGIDLDPALVTQIRTRVQQEDTSLPAFLLAGWQTLLWRLTGQSDMRLGYVCDGRQFAELHGVLGLLARWVPVHSHLEAHDTYREVVEQTRASLHAAYQWQDYFVPLQKHGATGEAETDAFAIGFEFVTCPTQQEAAGVSWTIDRQFVCHERFNVHLVCVQQDEALQAAFYYDAPRFDRAAIACLAEQFQTLLHSAASHPEAPLTALEILSQGERQRLLVAYNDTAADYPLSPCVHQLFEAQAARTPEKIALLGEEQALTYATLNRRANQLAHYLQRLGVGPEIRVAICLERSLEFVVGLLGILKAGGAYVPLDPALPPERLAFMVADTQAPVVVTQQRFVSTFTAPGIRLLCLDSAQERLAQERVANPPCSVTHENLLYVMYTSGSTGQPRGVAVEHRQLLNYMQAIVSRLEWPAEAHCALLSTVAADLGHTMLFPALCWGGCLHLISQEHAFAPEAFAAYCRRHPIDCLKIVPSHLAALLTATHPARILPDQRLVLGGEASRWDMLETVQALVPRCQIFNHYGPTEATVGVMTYRVASGNLAQRTARLPLGRPLANMQVYILEPHLQPAPVGVPGELYIGGAGLARGYLGDSRLSAEKFIPNPFATTPGARLYRTGDQARFLPDGSVEFLGRFDYQVKLRGFRIELGEIDMTLSRHAGVQETVVVVRDDSPGSPQLVAYLVPQQQATPTVQELRHWLQAQLPDYMVPARFVFLKALPLTANGKVDRQALPALETALERPAEGFVAPRTAVETILADIWAEVLGRTRVSVDDNFFALGGHSLLGIQVLARVHKTFQIEVPPRELFEAPTVARLAETLLRYEVRPGQIATIARLRQEIAHKSADEIRAMLQDKRKDLHSI